MTSQYAGKLRDAAFGRQFVGLTLKDFEQYDVATGKASGKVNAIKNPAPEAEADFRATLRGYEKKTSSSWMNSFLRRRKNDHEIPGGLQESIAEEGPEPPDPGRYRPLLLGAGEPAGVQSGVRGLAQQGHRQHGLPDQ